MSTPTIEPGDGSYRLRVHRARRPKAAFLFMPGGNCRPERYDWLAGLNSAGVTVLIVDTRPAGPPPPTVPMASNSQLLSAIAAAHRHAPAVYAAGHSAGAALVLDALDPPSNTRAVYPPGYEPPQTLSGVAVMGCSLQSRALNIVMDYRSETRLLNRPGDLPLLFLSGDHDAIAPPALMDKTRVRYAPPTAMIVLKGATHYGFAAGVDPGDNRTFDAPGADITTQRDRVVAYLAMWIADRPLEMQAGDLATVDWLRRRGPAVVV